MRYFFESCLAMNVGHRIVLLEALLYLAFTNAQITLNEVKFNNVVAKLESDVLEFGKEVERLYANRCNITTLNSCTKSNFADCLSEFPSQSCPGGDSFVIPQCGDGATCSGLFDFNVSTVSLPYDVVDILNDNKPTNEDVIETVCFTRQLDEWFVKKRGADYDYWQKLTGAQPLGMYFGSHTGVFRMYPARHSDSCNTFDPRLRPWYVAASSGPKNVIMILDTSGSMDSGGKLNLLKDAAHRVVNTLAVSDRVSLVTFNTLASVATDKTGSLFQATDKNKAILNEYIDALTAGNQTNFYAAFEKAFDVLGTAIENEFDVNCNTAILFLTDGRMRDPTSNRTEEEVLDFIVDGINSIRLATKYPVLLFTYSIKGDQGVETFPRQLACATEMGVWTHIQNSIEIPESLSNYYRLLTIGLGSKTNENFTAWVEPYIYKYGGVLGTTVSAPIYDRSKQPPAFIGVVGIGFTIAALNTALGTNNSEESIKRVVDASTPICPALNLSPCLLQSYRKQGGDNAVCPVNCTTWVDTMAQKCSNIRWNMTDVWNNVRNENKSYTEKVCCKVGTNATSDQCPFRGEARKVNAVAGWIVGAFGCLCVALTFGIIWCCGKEDNGRGGFVQMVNPSAPPCEERVKLEERPPPTNPKLLGFRGRPVSPLDSAGDCRA